MKTEIIKEICRHIGSMINRENDGEYIGTGNLKDNLLSGIDNWEEIEEDLGKGAGGELSPQKKRVEPKFLALYSSSALCVNAFAPFKKNFQKLFFLGYSNFTKASFEYKLHTGISYPNLDFYLENQNVIIGIESKFTEFLSCCEAHRCINFESYYNNDKLAHLPTAFHEELIAYYLEKQGNMCLDVAQLIKHTIALLKEKKEKEAVLLYVYWQPTEVKNSKYQSLFEQHEKEIKEFADKISPFVTFKAMSYDKLWKQNIEGVEHLDKHIQEFKARYSFSI